MTRALVLIRLSRVTDATTSPERQRKDCEDYCAQSGLIVVGVCEDLDVSRSTDPLQREGAGPWLRHRLDDFDVIVASKLDRFGGSTRHVHGLFSYLSQHGKKLRTADGSINTGGPAGEVILFILAWAAQMELAAISDRNTNAAQHNLKAGKYRGGVIPAGYRSERDEHGDWRTVPDEEGTAPVIREIFRRVLDGNRVSSIVADLNARGVQTAKDRQAVLMGREPEGRGWTVSNVNRILRSPSVIGQTVHRPLILDDDGKPKRDENGEKVYGPEQILFGDDGLPVQRSEPLVSLEDYYAVRKILDDRREAEPKQRRSTETTLLLRVLHCGSCGAPMWRLKGGPGRKPRYRCGSTQKGSSCGSGTVTEEYADDAVSGALLTLLGDFPHATREYHGGISQTETIAEIDGQLASLTEAVTRFSAGSTTLANLLDRMETLETRRAELEATPVAPSGYRWVPTGETFRERWAELNAAGRNDHLRSIGVRATWTRYTGQTGVLVIEFADPMQMVWSVIAPGLADRLTEDQMNEALRESGIAGIRCVIGSGEPPGTTPEPS